MLTVPKGEFMKKYNECTSGEAMNEINRAPLGTCPASCSVRPVIGDVVQFEDEDHGRLVVTIRLKGTMASRFRDADPSLVQIAFSTLNAMNETP